jgi:hypothetical protein
MTRRPAPLSTTGIGSLPHSQRELALQTALAVDIPYLPQLPQRDAAEFMLPQALEGLPGLILDGEGNVSVDEGAFQAGRGELEERLAGVLEGDDIWEPSASAWAAWQPFVWEVRDRKLPFAKVQIAGPVTTRWALKTTDGRSPTEVDGLGRLALELILARAVSMTRTLRTDDCRPIVFLDEPGLFALNAGSPGQLVTVKELSIVVDLLKKEGALVGLHCCSNTVWEEVVSLGWDYLAVDSLLSLLPLLGTGKVFDQYVRGGGGLLLGIIPTNTEVDHYQVGTLIDTTRAALRQHQEGGGVASKTVLSQSLLSPACGLALRSVPDSETIFRDLKKAQKLLRELEGTESVKAKSV